MSEQRKKSLETFEKYCIKKNPLNWHIWKKAFDLGVQFEKQQSIINHINSIKMAENQNFGQAIESLKQGKRVARQGWNGKGMFLFLLPAGTVPTKAIHDPTLREVIEQEIGGETFEALGSIRMFTADKKILTGWLASQTDMLSNDWYTLD